jgi:hypothetical protein
MSHPDLLQENKAPKVEQKAKEKMPLGWAIYEKWSLEKAGFEAGKIKLSPVKLIRTITLHESHADELNGQKENTLTLYKKI